MYYEPDDQAMVYTANHQEPLLQCFEQEAIYERSCSVSSNSSFEVRPIKNEVLTLKTAKKIFPKIRHLIMNLCSVYFLEYCAITCFSDRISLQVRREMAVEDQDFQIKQYYVILSNCYQVGVFMSRSSLAYYKVHRVSTLTLL